MIIALKLENSLTLKHFEPMMMRDITKKLHLKLKLELLKQLELSEILFVLTID
jgi:hypothetical protein